MVLVLAVSGSPLVVLPPHDLRCPSLFGSLNWSAIVAAHCGALWLVANRCSSGWSGSVPSAIARPPCCVLAQQRAGLEVVLAPAQPGIRMQQTQVGQKSQFLAPDIGDHPIDINCFQLAFQHLARRSKGSNTSRERPCNSTNVG